jgi:hypothetical protein
MFVLPLVDDSSRTGSLPAAGDCAGGSGFETSPATLMAMVLALTCLKDRPVPSNSLRKPSMMVKSP